MLAPCSHHQSVYLVAARLLSKPGSRGNLRVRSSSEYTVSNSYFMKLVTMFMPLRRPFTGHFVMV